VFFRVFFEFFTGTDWKGHRFTTLSELLGYDDKGRYLTKTDEHKIGERKGGKLTGRTVAPGGRKGPIGWAQLPSYTISETRGMTPVQVQNFLGWLHGEIEGFDAIGRSIGAHVSSTYPTERTITKDFVDEWIKIKQNGRDFTALKSKVRDYNDRQDLRGDEGIPISWSTIAKKGLNITKAERKGERRESEALN